MTNVIREAHTSASGVQAACSEGSLIANTSGTIRVSFWQQVPSSNQEHLQAHLVSDSVLKGEALPGAAVPEGQGDALLELLVVYYNGAPE